MVKSIDLRQEYLKVSQISDKGLGLKKLEENNFCQKVLPPLTSDH